MNVVSIAVSALCAVTMLALTATCSGPTTTAAVVYEPQADGLHVLDHGSEPRRLIAYKVRELAPFIMTMTGGVKATEEGAKNTYPAYNHEGLMRAVLRGPTADGGFTGNMIDLGSSRARALGFVVGEDGRMLAPDRSEQKSLLFVQVPQMPVGVGARWRTRLPVSMLGDTLPVVVEVQS